jgi:hypothetical protein
MISYASCGCESSFGCWVERWRLRKPPFSATSTNVKDRTPVVTSYCRDAANASNLDQGGYSNGCALFLAFELQFAGSSRQAKGKDVLRIDDTA